MIQYLLGAHAEDTSFSADFYPARGIAVIPLGEVFGAHADFVTVVGEFHGGRVRGAGGGVKAKR